MSVWRCSRYVKMVNGWLDHDGHKAYTTGYNASFNAALQFACVYTFIGCNMTTDTNRSRHGGRL